MLLKFFPFAQACTDIRSYFFLIILILVSFDASIFPGYGYGHSYNNGTSQLAREQRSSYFSSSQKRSSARPESTDISVQVASEKY